MTPVTFDLPLRTRFRGLTRRYGMVWHGEVGWAEFSPFEEYNTDQCRPWLMAALEAAHQPAPPPLRRHVPVNITVPAVGPEQAAAIVASSGGCQTAKVKVAEPGQSIEQDVNRLAAVRQALGPSGNIRVDANGAWTTEQAIDYLSRLDRAAGGLQYAEQPCAGVEELATVRRRTKVPIAADESIRQATDPYLVARLEAADVVVLKVQPLGGVRSCLDLAAAIGLPVVVSSAVETVVGIAQGLALAAALPKAELACGLATGQLLAQDLARDLFPVVNGQIEVAPARVEPDLLRQSQADPATNQRWQRRLAKVTALPDQGQRP
ncbi:MAG: o-succinylbenzoate synthase [Micrococcales bacterium]|nr:o-succinylbenzoate synthase [Micrococcales bacterium]